MCFSLAGSDTKIKSRYYQSLHRNPLEMCQSFTKLPAKTSKNLFCNSAEVVLLYFPWIEQDLHIVQHIWQLNN